MPASLQAILAPRSIAVIGASRTPGTIGHEIVRNLIRGGFTGSVYPVNPHARAICSIPAWPEVEAIPEQLDQAIIVVPKELVMGVAEAAIRKGVKGLVVISAGFREVGGEGAEREQRLTALVRAHGVRMIGPNCMGVMNSDPAVSMNGTFASSLPPTGTTGFVSQSGALGLSVLDYAREYGIGISQFVSVGNKPDVSGNDLLLAWESDPRVQVILMYVESFGNPARFLEIAGRLTREKPLIVVKSGRSRAGARAASSHTGALAASDAAVDALARRMAGVPKNQLMMQKLMINQAYENMGLASTQMIATLFDGITRHSPEGVWFKSYAEKHGFHAAVKWRDSGRDIPGGKAFP